ncbi:CAP domain-containing protein [Corynebacterium casei]|uniref:CAP domain-containing protein n=1 Tax=Corynebacterium casei TaxID=160386 RepID=UPI003FD3C55E
MNPQQLQEIWNNILNGQTQKALAAVLALITAVSGVGSIPQFPVNTSSVNVSLPITGSSNQSITLTELETEFINKLNEYRISRGKSPVRVSAKLTRQARSWSQTMATQNHYRHSNDNVWENIAYNYYGSADYVLTQWKNSPGHNRTMLLNQHSTVGFGQRRASNGYYYATLQFE